MEKGKRIGAVILAGGQGKRMNSPVQKQYMMLAGRPVITYALEVFSCLQVDCTGSGGWRAGICQRTDSKTLWPF